ncbi:hypothetical protein ACFQ0I_14785 [Mariniflexile aquimaris]|uniref:Uncharacterized protein n=1 Tax=Mariniflexile aquimaris TaxID=881009 RepID=A0ABW3BWY7_9FLAO
MLSNNQSLILCGIMTAGIFIAGILEVLDNYIAKTILTIVFLAIVLNLIYTNTKSKKEENDLK